MYLVVFSWEHREQSRGFLRSPAAYPKVLEHSACSGLANKKGLLAEDFRSFAKALIVATLCSLPGEIIMEAKGSKFLPMLFQVFDM